MERDPLLDRLQQGLSPDYRVERELGSGGMGRVYLVHDLTLNAPVAVKVLRPELATAQAAEAFLREAQLLARIRHPNIVTIFHAGTGAGLQYYIMEAVPGPTLEQRLQQGTLRIAHAIKLGRDLLDGLETVHGAGVIHRDIKPSNIFLVGDPPRALLADFGIAGGPSIPRRTASGRTLVSGEGTPGYMAPEQLTGDAITTRTDLYATGAVIYEAVTGRRFPDIGEKVSWRGFPRSIARVLRRATHESADERWTDARTFRRALWRTRTIGYLVRAAILALGGILLGAAGILGLGRAIAPGPGTLSVAVPRFEYQGPSHRRDIADSLVQLVRAELRAHPDFRVTASRPWLPFARSALTIHGRVAVRGDSLQVQLGDVRGLGSGVPMSEVQASLSNWAVLRDSLTYRILLAVWDTLSPLAASLPRHALPRTPAGLARFLEGEQHIAAGRWENAYRAYSRAEETDSTCWLCSWRLSEVERWLGLEHDPARADRYLRHLESFPPWYASLIRAAQLPLAARLDTLRAATARWRGFFLGYLQLGDELLHRGPLAGSPRAAAIPFLEEAIRLKPDFAPAWEHLAWVYIAEGDSAGARRALRGLDRRQLGNDPFATTLRSLLGVAFAFRLGSEQAGLDTLKRALSIPAVTASPVLAAGPRMLGGFDAPRGEVAFGELLAAAPNRDLQRSGLIAQMMGSLALGKPTKSLQLARELDLADFAAQLEAALVQLDPAALRGAIPRRRPEAGDDLFARTIARLQRAADFARGNDIAAARRELVWHEHTDLVGLPTGPPQVAEVDWAFGTLARWRLAPLLAQSGARGLACRAYRDVVRLWSEGEPLYRARADSARTQLTRLDCQAVLQ